MKNRILIVIIVLLALVAGFFLARSFQKPAAPAPTNTAPAPTPTPTPAPQPAETTDVKIFLVAIDGSTEWQNAAPSATFGCNDRMVAVTKTVPKTTAVLRAALDQLLALHEANHPPEGLYNALADSNLVIKSVTIVAGKATVTLTGSTQLGGVCDGPRFVEQIRRTVRQFPSVTSDEITVNGKPLDDMASGR